MLLSRPLNTLFSTKYDYNVHWDVNNQLLPMRRLCGARWSHPARILTSLASSAGFAATTQHVSFPLQMPRCTALPHHAFRGPLYASVLLAFHLHGISFPYTTPCPHSSVMSGRPNSLLAQQERVYLAPAASRNRARTNTLESNLGNEYSCLKPSLMITFRIHWSCPWKQTHYITYFSDAPARIICENSVENTDLPPWHPCHKVPLANFLKETKAEDLQEQMKETRYTATAHKI